MTDFVLEQETRLESAVKSRSKEFSSQYLQRLFNYASFLKQPLKLEMFVPCDKKGNVLRKVPMAGYDSMTGWNCPQDEIDFHNELDIKRIAREKVLFEIVGDYQLLTNSNRFNIIDFKDDESVNRIILEKDHSKENISIEWLCDHERILLTQSAIKHLGL